MLTALGIILLAGAVGFAAQTGREYQAHRLSLVTYLARMSVVLGGATWGGIALFVEFGTPLARYGGVIASLLIAAGGIVNIILIERARPSGSVR
jgi:hypothetical protein